MAKYMACTSTAVARSDDTLWRLMRRTTGKSNFHQQQSTLEMQSSTPLRHNMGTDKYNVTPTNSQRQGNENLAAAQFQEEQDNTQ